MVRIFMKTVHIFLAIVADFEFSVEDNSVDHIVLRVLLPAAMRAAKNLGRL